MKDPTVAEKKLNVFALPSQTAILFSLIVVVLLGSLLIGSIGPSPICIWPLALGLLLLPLRSFLAQPERELARHNLEPAGDELSDLQQAIETQARDIGLRKIPQLMVSPDDGLKKPYIFGTFRRLYVALSHKAALRLQDELASSQEAPMVQAKLIHELYHFKTGDYWQMGYIRQLLRTVFLFMTWAAAFFCGLGFLLLLAAPDFLQMNSPEMIGQVKQIPPAVEQLFIQVMPSMTALQSARQQAAPINLSLVLNFAVSATLPFVIIGGVLWGLYWPKLWRMRELYADAGVVSTQGEVYPYLAAITGIPLFIIRKHPYPSVEKTAPIQRKNKGLDRIRALWRRIRRLFTRHPSSAHRIACVMNPSEVFGDWTSTAMLAGSLALLLDILLVTPLTMLYAGKWPMHFSTLVIFVLVSLSLIPKLAQGQSTWQDILRIVGVVMGLRLAWLLLTIALLFILLFFAPEMLSMALQAAIAASAHFAGYSDDLGVDNLSGFVIRASILNTAQVIIILLALLFALLVINRLLQRLFTWYSLPQASRWLMRAAYSLIAVAALSLALTFLPPITNALLRPNELANPQGIVRGCLGLTLAVASLGSFLYADQRYGHQCPSCGNPVSGPYRLGRPCPTCGKLLHPWLIAEYRS